MFVALKTSKLFDSGFPLVFQSRVAEWVPFHGLS